MLDVAVIGAGVVGASIAWRLSQSGARVTVIERAVPTSGTSGASFAWVNASAKSPRDYFELNLAGLREHQRLAAERGEAPWYHPGGNLVWVAEDELPTTQRRADELRSWHYRVEWWTARDVQAELEPGLRCADPAQELVFYPEEAWVDVPLLVSRLLELSRTAGAEVIEGDPVVAIEASGGRVRGVRLGSGKALVVDAVVNAAGPWADRVAGLLGLPLPLAPTSGLVVRAAVNGPSVRRVLHTPLVNVRPDGSGYLCLHHADADAQLGDRRELSVGDPLSGMLLERARRILAGLGESTVVAAAVGIRPIPADGRSCIGAVSAVSGYYEAVTHSGVTLGPLIGRLLAQEILTGTIEPVAAPFRPDRLRRA
jgi:glycine/D-amino acid oxidase-like deaminating enzyme